MSVRARLWCGCLSWLSLLLLAGPRPGVAQLPAAAPLPTVTTLVDPCVQVDDEVFQRLLDIELGTSVQLNREPTAAGRVAHVRVRCVPGGIELFLQDAVTRKSMTRVLVAGGLAADKERLLALAVAEFVVASWIELAAIPEPAVQPVGPPPSDEDLKVVRRVVTQRTLEGTVRFAVVLSGTSWLAKEQPTLLGPGVRISHRLGQALMWQVGADLGFGNETLPQGQVDFNGGTAHGAIGLSGVEDMWEAGFAVGFRAGYLRTGGFPERGSALDGDSETGITGGPMLLTTLVLHAGTLARVGMEIEAGYPAWRLRVTAGEDVVMGFDGPWLRGGLLVGVEM